MAAMTLTFEHRDAEQQVLALRDDEQVGVVEYHLDGTVATVTHTGTDPAHRGQGIAGQLTEAALADFAARGWTVVAQCPYTQRYLDEHPEHDALREDRRRS